MGETRRELCGLRRTPSNALVIAFADAVVVVVAHDVVAMDGVAAADGLVVQWC